MREHPLLFPLAALIAGILFADAGLPLWSASGLFLGISVAAVSCLWTRPSVLLPVLSLIFCLSGILLYQGASVVPPEAEKLLRMTDGGPVTVTGLVVARPGISDGRQTFRLLIEEVTREEERLLKPGRLLVTLPGGRTDIMTGDRVRFVGRVKAPRLLGMPGEYNIVRHLALQGIYARAYLNDSGELHRLETAVAYPVQRAFDTLAADFGRLLDLRVPAPESGILRALLLGQRGYIPQLLEREYAVSGVNHILSVSGFHVGIIAVTTLFLLRWVGRRSALLLLSFNLYRWSLAAVLPLILCYLFLTGAAPATVRSVVMLGALLIASLLEREHDLLDMIILAALLMLLAVPGLLFQISFQLSFVALWGIVALTPECMKLLPIGRESWLYAPVALCAASSAAILATSPLVAYHFHIFSLTGLVSNLIIVPLMGYGAVISGFTGLLLSFLSEPLSSLCITFAGWLVTLCNRVIALLAEIPVWYGVNPSAVDVSLSLAGLAAFSLIAVRRNALTVLIALFACWSTLSLLSARQREDRLEAVFFSMGQAESSLVRLPDGKSLLIDTGGRLFGETGDWSERLLVPALWKMGIKVLDLVIISHPHPDHMGGLAGLAAAMPLRQVWLGGMQRDVPLYQKELSILESRGIPVRFVNGTTAAAAFGDGVIEPFWPLPRLDSDDRNDHSLVFRLLWGENSLLFTGDIGWDVADYLATHYGQRLRSTLLKIPHHGSRHSDAPTLYAAVKPAWGVIFAGKENSFGLPAAETLASLHAVRIPLLRTDLDGTIRVTFNRFGTIASFHEGVR